MKRNTQPTDLTEALYGLPRTSENPDKQELIDILCIWFLVALVLVTCVLGYIAFEGLNIFLAG